MLDDAKLSRACAIAFEVSGFLITPEQARHLLLVPASKREQLTARLGEELTSLLEAYSPAIRTLESLLSEFLRPEACHGVLKDVSLLLLSRGKDLHLSAVKTEVLASWLAEIETSDSSSQKENNCCPELPTPGSTETVVPTGGAVTAMGMHTRTDGGVV